MVLLTPCPLWHLLLSILFFPEEDKCFFPISLSSLTLTRLKIMLVLFCAPDSSQALFSSLIFKNRKLIKQQTHLDASKSVWKICNN